MNDEPYEAVNEWNSCQDELMITTRMVRARTVDMAIAAGRSPLEIRQRDYELAKREITGESEPDRQMEVLYPGFSSPVI
jgi:hypothetical protein